MDYLWTPWRYQYISEATKSASSCIFCEAIAANDDAKMLVVFRGKKNYVILNRYPYTSGHVMIVPYQHASDFAGADIDTMREMIQIAQRVQRVLEETYHPEGYNLGMNLGRAAGAGVQGHLHLHVLPRWCGDSNFMTVTGETRVEPEDLATTYKKLQAALS
ncbi:MAG: HIT family protein [Candidatus Acidiferrales bacterium]